MSDPAAPDRAGRATQDGRPAGLTDADIDAILADFRGWLTELADPPPAAEPTAAVDLHTLVAQFTALRHDVNLQTKATRAAVEHLAKPPEPAADPAVVPSLIDAADALAASAKQLAKLAAALPRAGFLARLFTPAADVTPLRAAADGYAISLRRIDRALATLGVTPIDATGRPFDPDTMEAVEQDTNGPSGTVTDELRRGYRRDGKVIRFAQVKVAK